MSGRGEGQRTAWRPRLDLAVGSLPGGSSSPATLSLAGGGGASPPRARGSSFFLSRLPFWAACSQNPGTAFLAFLSWVAMALLVASWGLSFQDDLAYPRTGSPALRDRLWTLLLTFLSGLSVPFLVMAVLVSVYYRITRPISFIMGGMFVSVLANLVSAVANVVVHLTANEKMRYVCYRHLSPHLTSPLITAHSFLSGVSDSTCAYSIADEIYCGTKLQDLCTMFLLGFDGTICCLAGMLIILVSSMVHAYNQRKRMKQVIRAQEADFDFVLHINDVDT